MSVAFIAALMISSGCMFLDSNDPKKAGEKAAKEICDCFNKKSEDAIEECIDKLEEKYTKWEDNEEFGDAVEDALRKNCKAAADFF